jgi:hypothetical protein
MSDTTRFDIRIPIGALFALFGIILTLYGVFTWSDTNMYAVSEEIVINFWWGLVMTIFGAAMLYFGLRSRRRTTRTAAGTATEEREHRLGLEREK